MLISHAGEKLKREDNYSEIPGNDGWPFFGHSFQVMLNIRGLFQRMYERYGTVFRLNILFDRSVVFLGPHAAETVLVDHDKNFPSANAYRKVFGDFYSQCILLRDFEDHAYVRQLLLPAFKGSAMTEYLQRMNPIITKAVNQWPAQRDFPFFTASKELSLNLSAAVFLGLDFGPHTQQVNKALESFLRATLAIIRKPVPGLSYAKGIKARQFLTEYLRGVIPHKRRQPSFDMLSQLCHAKAEDGSQLSDDEIIEHMIFMLIAAHDSTTSALTSMVYLLAKHPEWQERLRTESLGLAADCVSYAELGKLKSAGLVLKETLRLQPPILMVARQALRACEIEGVRIPAKTTVWVCPDFTHHMPEWWTNPDTFDPERFNEERAEHKGHRFAYMPFGGGAHMCIGFHLAEMQLKAVLHQLLLKYRLLLPKDYEAKYQLLPIPKPKDNLPLIMEPLGEEFSRHPRVAPPVAHQEPVSGQPLAVCPYGHR